MKSIFNYTEEELLDILIKNGFKKYNKDQILDWIYKKKVYDFDMMSNLSKNLIEFLKQNFEIKLLDIETFEESIDTKKYLLKLSDNNKIECVLMFHDYGKSLCVSTEVGCNMGCAFCESGRLKKVRNLETSEMILELLTIENNVSSRIDNIVIMGIGEPFDNYSNFEKFINILTNPKMIELGSRKITVSTCGLVPKIYEFADMKTGVNLAISLHAPNDELRNQDKKITQNEIKINEHEKTLNILVNSNIKQREKITEHEIMLNKQQNELMLCIDDVKNLYQKANELKSLLNEDEKKLNALALKNEIEVNQIKEQCKEGIQKVNEITDVLNKHTEILTEHSREIAKIQAISYQNTEKIEELYGLFNNQEIRIKNLEGRVDKIEQILQKHEESIFNLAGNVTEMKKQMNNVLGRIKNIENEIEIMKKEQIEEKAKTIFDYIENMNDDELYEFAQLIIDLRNMEKPYDLNKVIEGIKMILKKYKKKAK